MKTAISDPAISVTRITVHSSLVRITHWINALAILIMLSSGWKIYNASPLFGFRFPDELTLGGWLAGALQWHFAIMWLLVINSVAYLILGIATGHFLRKLTPVTRVHIREDIEHALRFKLRHKPGVYNALQRIAYLGAILMIVLLIASGLAIWKPVQLQALTWLFGGYDAARIVHFFAMFLLVLFLVVHVIMALLVPRTLLSMITGKATIKEHPTPQPKPENIPSTESGDAL